MHQFRTGGSVKKLSPPGLPPVAPYPRATIHQPVLISGRCLTLATRYLSDLLSAFRARHDVLWHPMPFATYQTFCLPSVPGTMFYGTRCLSQTFPCQARCSKALYAVTHFWVCPTHTASAVAPPHMNTFVFTPVTSWEQSSRAHVTIDILFGLCYIERIPRAEVQVLPRPILSC